MNGKVLKVAEYDLTFGKSARMINVFGIFRYKGNNNLYIVYADVLMNNNVIRYGSSHIKENSALSMKCSSLKDQEIIKEYIFKITEKQKLDNFEIIKLDNIDEVEIIGSNMLEIKKEVLDSLIDLTIPKSNVKEEVVSNSSNKKRRGCSLKILLFLIILLILGSGIYYYFVVIASQETVYKRIICTKSYQHEEISDVNVDEEDTFNFNNKDSLESVDIVSIYNFLTEDSYLDFINKGLYYKYMPDSDDAEGGWDKDDDAYTFKIITKDRVDTAYNKPTGYEEVLAYYKSEGYSCQENIEK